ncbi:hypothetical protein CJ307_31355 [Klebsiella quasipneumoniae]|nr:hypothetical protein CJ307_31355 [Klebsiella quasipneumoniae]
MNLLLPRNISAGRCD